MISNLRIFFLCLVVTVRGQSIENEKNSFCKCKNFPMDSAEGIEAVAETSIQNQNCFDSRRGKDRQSLNKVLRVLQGPKTDPFRFDEDDPMESFLLQYLISMDQDLRAMYLDLRSLMTSRASIQKRKEEEQKVPERMCTLLSNNLLLASQSNSVGEVPVVKLGTFPTGTTKKHLDLNCYLQEFEGPVEVQWKIENPPDHLLIYNISGFSDWTTETLEIGFTDSESFWLDKMRKGFQSFSSWTFSPEISFKLISESATRAKAFSIEWLARKKSELEVLPLNQGEFDARNEFSGTSNSLTQVWAILATPPRNSIKFSFPKSDIQNCASCECNQLMVSSDPNFKNEVKNLCWFMPYPKFTFGTNFLFVKTSSNGAKEGVGTRISYNAFTAVNLGKFSSSELNELVMKRFLDHLETEGPVILSWTIEVQKDHIFIYEIDGLDDCMSENVEIRFAYHPRHFPSSNECINKNLFWSWTRENTIEFRITSKDALSTKKMSMTWTSHDISGFSGVLTNIYGTIDDSLDNIFVDYGHGRKWFIMANPPRNRIQLQFSSDERFIPFNCRDYSLKISDISGNQSETISFCKSSPHEMSYISSGNILFLEYKRNHRRTKENVIILYSTLTEVDIGRLTKAKSEEIFFENYITEAESPALVTLTIDNLPNHLLRYEIKGFSNCYGSTIQKRYVGGVFSSMNDECETDSQLAFMTLEPEVNFMLIVKNESLASNLSMHFTLLDVAEYEGNVYTNTSGNISSLNYPDRYEPNALQKMMILSNYSKSKISLMFHDFEVEDTSVCQFDSLRISTIPLQHFGEQALCGFDQSSNLSLNTNLLTLTFTSDNAKNGRGFHLSYNIQYEIATVNVEETQKIPRELFTNQLKYVYGPGTVTWTIENPKNKILIYYINGLQNCLEENLEIRDGNLGKIPSTRSYCLDETTFASWSNQSKIEFKLNLEDVQRAREVSLKWRIINEEDFQVVFAASTGIVNVEFNSHPKISVILATSPRNRIKLKYDFDFIMCSETILKASYDVGFTKGVTNLCWREHNSPFISRTSFLFISSQLREHGWTPFFSFEYDIFSAEDSSHEEEI